MRWCVGEGYGGGEGRGAGGAGDGGGGGGGGKQWTSPMALSAAFSDPPAGTVVIVRGAISCDFVLPRS